MDRQSNLYDKRRLLGKTKFSTFAEIGQKIDDNVPMNVKIYWKFHGNIKGNNNWTAEFLRFLPSFFVKSTTPSIFSTWTCSLVYYFQRFSPFFNFSFYLSPSLSLINPRNWKHLNEPANASFSKSENMMKQFLCNIAQCPFQRSWDHQKSASKFNLKILCFTNPFEDALKLKFHGRIWRLIFFVLRLKIERERGLNENYCSENIFS